MADEEIYQMWGEFISSKEYAQYFLDNKERWKRELENVKKYIQKTGKRPTETCKNKNEKQLKRWIVTQVMSFEPRDYIMKEDDIYQLWKDFIYSDEFKKYFQPQILKTRGKRLWKKLKNIQFYMENGLLLTGRIPKILSGDGYNLKYVISLVKNVL